MHTPENGQLHRDASGRPRRSAGWLARAAVPVAFLLGVLAIRLARRARRRLERTLGRAGGQSPARLGRIFGWLGVYLALIGAISLGFYYVEYHLLA